MAEEPFPFGVHDKACYCRGGTTLAIYLKNSRKDGGADAVTAKYFEVDVYASL